MISKNIEAARVAAGLSKAEMARELNIPYTTYNSYERGEAEPKLETLVNIAGILKITPAALVSTEYAKKSAQNQKYIESILAGEIKTAPDGRTLNELLEEEKQEQYKVVAEVYSGQIKEQLIRLNEKGMRVAVERVEELTKIPEYQNDKNN